MFKFFDDQNQCFFAQDINVHVQKIPKFFAQNFF